MKTQILATVIALAATLPAQASYFQNYCASADARVVNASGHGRNYFTVVLETERGVQKKINLEQAWQTYDIAEGEKTVVKKEGHDSCSQKRDDVKPGEIRPGAQWSRTVTFETTTIKRKDGKALPKGFPGLADDGLSAKIELLCESNYSNMIACRD